MELNEKKLATAKVPLHWLDNRAHVKDRKLPNHGAGRKAVKETVYVVPVVIYSGRCAVVAVLELTFA